MALNCTSPQVSSTLISYREVQHRSVYMIGWVMIVTSLKPSSDRIKEGIEKGKVK